MQHDEQRGDAVAIGLLAVVHGIFWLGVGLAFGRLLWGAP
jgi:hypothetical protein